MCPVRPCLVSSLFSTKHSLLGRLTPEDCISLMTFSSVHFDIIKNLSIISLSGSVRVVHVLDFIYCTGPAFVNDKFYFISFYYYFYLLLMCVCRSIRIYININYDVYLDDKRTMGIYRVYAQECSSIVRIFTIYQTY